MPENPKNTVCSESAHLKVYNRSPEMLCTNIDRITRVMTEISIYEMMLDVLIIFSALSLVLFFILAYPALKSVIGLDLNFYSIYLYSGIIALIISAALFMRDFWGNRDIIYGKLNFLYTRSYNRKMKDKVTGDVRNVITTAYENRTSRNVIVEKLINDAKINLANLAASNIISRKKNMLRVFALILLCFVMLFSSFSAIPGSGGYYGGHGSLADGTGEGDGFTSGNKTESEFASNKMPDIFGEKSVAKIGEQEINITIHTDYGKDSGGLGEPIEELMGESPYTSGNGSELYAPDTFRDNLPDDEKEKEVIRRYFNDLNNPG